MDLADLPALAALGLAAAAGAVSFLSPCVAPLLPGYLAFLSGAGSEDPAPSTDTTGPVAPRRAGVLPRACGFVLGFVTLFAALGAGAAGVTAALVEQRARLELVGGLVVALIGLAMAFDRSLVPAPVARAVGARTAALGGPASTLAAMPVGAAFALAWTPCIGPALAAILALAASGGEPLWGATLLVAYGLGLGAPFLLGALALERTTRASRTLRRRAPAVRTAGGVVLVLVGVAMATGRFGELTARLARVAPDWLP